MSGDDRPTYARRAVRPVECLRAGWALVRDDYWLFVGISLTGLLIAEFAPMGILYGPMICGIYFCLFRKDRGRRIRYDMLFKGFEYFLPSLVASLVILGIPTVATILGCGVVVFAMIGSGMQGGPPDPTTMFGGMGIVYAVAGGLWLVVSVLFFFAFPLIVAREMSGLQALGLSLRAVRANLGGILGLVLLDVALSVVGVLVCCVGGLFVVPIHLAANIVAFRQVFGDEDDADAITDD